MASVAIIRLQTVVSGSRRSACVGPSLTQASTWSLEVNQKNQNLEESRNIKVATRRWTINSFVGGEAGVWSVY